MLRWLLLSVCYLPIIVRADPVFRIEIGKDYQKYTNADLQRRVWELERAVFQLQQKVFELQANGSAAESWICTVKAMGTSYTGTGTTKALAMQQSMDACKSARGEKDMFCDKPRCEH